MVEPIKIQIALSDLLDVINAHNNPVVAAAILDATYKSPLESGDSVPRFHKEHKVKNDDGTQDHYRLLFKSYDKWSNKVTFEKDHPNAWSRSDTMSLSEWRGARDFDPYPFAQADDKSSTIGVF
jgi:hypothetical protein